MTNGGTPRVGAYERVLRLWRVMLWGGLTALLLFPRVAMQFTREVAWTGLDFAVFAALLIGAGAAFELTVWKVRDVRVRAMLALVIAAAALLVWIQGAVGIV